MKKLSTLILCNLIAFNCFAYDYSKAVTNLEGHSEQIIMMAGEEIKHHLPLKDVNKLLEVNFSNYKDILNNEVEFNAYRLSNESHDFQRALNKYNKNFKMVNETNSLITNVSDGVGVLVKGGFALAGGAFSGGVGVATGLAIGNAVYSKTLGRVIENFKESNIKLAENFLASYLKDKVGENRLKNLTPKKLRRLNRRYDLVRVLRDKAVCESCEAGEKSLIQGAAIQMLTDLSEGNANDIIGLKNAIKNNNESIKQTAQKLNDFKNVFDTFAVQTKQSISDLFTNQQEINKYLNVIDSKVNQNSDNISRNAADIRFLQDAVFSKASPAEKLEAYRRGAYGKEFSTEKIKILKLQAKFNLNIGNVINGANQVVGIAQSLGVQIPNDLLKAVDFGTKAYTAIDGALGSAMSGNYLGAALSLTSAFSGVASPAATRHSQVMEALAVINRKLDIVIGNQQLMLANQRTMIENQRKIFNELKNISNQIQKNTELLFNQGLLTRLDINIIKSGISELLNDSISNCETLVSQTNDQLFNASDLSPFERRKKGFTEKYFESCQELVSKMAIVRRRGNFSLTFSEVLNSDEGAEYKKYYYDLYTDAFNKLVPTESEQEKLMMFGNEHVASVYDLKTTYQGLKEVDNSVAKNYFASDLWRDYTGFLNVKSLFDNPIYYPAVKDVSKLANQVFFYLDVVENCKFPTLEKLYSMKGDGKLSKGYQFLSDTYTLIEMSNIQTSLLNGQLLIPVIYEKIGEEGVDNILAELLKSSEIFEKNFLRYFILNKNEEYHQAITSNQGERSKGEAYSNAYLLKDEVHMAEVLRVSESEGYSVTCLDEDNEKAGCYIKFGNQEEMRLPSPETLAKGAMIQHPATQELINAKFTTRANMEGYLFSNKLKEESELDARAYRLLLLNSARELPRINIRPRRTL